MDTSILNRLVAVLLPLVVILLIGLGFVLLFANGHADAEIVLGLLVILGACALLYMLYLIAFGFSILGLDDKSQALGLPDGSIRALIALLLIVIWVIIGIFLFSYVSGLFTSMNSKLVISQDGIKFATTFYATMSTLVVALAGFYFGTNSVKVAQGGPTTGPAPVFSTIDSQEPAPWAGKNITFTITGKNFQSQPTQPLVKFVKNSTEVIATGIASNDTKIIGNILIPSTATPGEQWDVTIVNPDGTDSGQSGKGAFTIK